MFFQEVRGYFLCIEFLYIEGRPAKKKNIGTCFIIRIPHIKIIALWSICQLLIFDFFESRVDNINHSNIGLCINHLCRKTNGNKKQNNSHSTVAHIILNRMRM